MMYEGLRWRSLSFRKLYQFPFSKPIQWVRLVSLLGRLGALGLMFDTPGPAQWFSPSTAQMLHVCRLWIMHSCILWAAANPKPLWRIGVHWWFSIPPSSSPCHRGSSPSRDAHTAPPALLVGTHGVPKPAKFPGSAYQWNVPKIYSRPRGGILILKIFKI